MSELAAIYGAVASPRLSPLELILLENASYLVDDERRRQVFEKLRARIGVTPEAILRHDAASIAAVIAEGGMKASMRAEKVLECARIAKKIGVERLNAAVLHGDSSAKRLLQQFPGIGEPSADKIMLLCGGVSSVAPDSNALRVLLRLGYTEEKRNYAQTYRLAVSATRAEIHSVPEAIQAHLLLRKHGQEICKRSLPRCELCPLRQDCHWYQSKMSDA